MVYTFTGEIAGYVSEELRKSLKIGGGYISPDNGRVEFTLSEDFDGKIGLVFCEAGLKDLKITAWYE